MAASEFTKHQRGTPTQDPTPLAAQRLRGPGKLGKEGPRRGARIGRVVAGSFVTGLAVSLLLAAAPFVAPRAADVGGAALVGFALGWGMLWVGSVRFTDQPQRWAVIPAIVMGSSGTLLISVGDTIDEVLGWVLPPVFLATAAWMVIQSRRQLRSRARRWLVSPVIAVVVLGALGAGYETVHEAVDVDVLMPGRLVDVGGHRLHLHCTGTGSPTVVLQPGAGMMSSDLGWIAGAVADETRVCVYDRAGRGWSDSASTRQDAIQIADDLHTLLQRANVPGPYVLGGHSFGGLYALTFAARYPDEVAGMVLIDSTQPAPASGFADASAESADDRTTYALTNHATALISTSIRLGLGRIVAQMPSSLPTQSTSEQNASLTTARHWQSTLNEYATAKWSTAQATALQDFGEKPLIVLTAGVGHDRAWMRGHEELAKLSTQSAHRVIEDADHAGLVVEQQQAAATTQAILDVVAAVRSGKQLGG